jgi:hypothetical protein
MPDALADKTIAVAIDGVLSEPANSELKSQAARSASALICLPVKSTAGARSMSETERVRPTGARTFRPLRRERKSKRFERFIESDDRFAFNLAAQGRGGPADPPVPAEGPSHGYEVSRWVWDRTRPYEILAWW